MIFSAKDNVLYPIDDSAKRFLDGKSGEIDMVPVTKAKRRSLEANAKYWAWCHGIEQAHGMDPGEAHRYNKWYFGLPVLTRAHPEYRDKLLSMLRALDYEDRLAAMDLVQCTSLFSTSEMTDYMDAVQRHWAAEGVVLE